MKRSLALGLALCRAILVSLAAICLPAIAQTASDCAKARDPARCEARQGALEICKEKRRAERRRCLEEQLPPPDCRKATFPERCLAAVAANVACRAKPVAEQRQCLREQLRPAAPSSR